METPGNRLSIKSRMYRRFLSSTAHSWSTPFHARVAVGPRQGMPMDSTLQLLYPDRSPCRRTRLRSRSS